MIAYCRLATEPLNFIVAESAQHFPNETGGMLVGKVVDDCVLITHATGPGPMALHSRYEFRRDGEYSQEILDQIVADTKGAYDYIGEWHSHPLKAGPSIKDVEAMNWISRNTKYKVIQPILCLCIQEIKHTWRINIYQFREQTVIRLKHYLL